MILLKEHSMEFALLGKQVAELIVPVATPKTNKELTPLGMRKTALYTQLQLKSFGFRGLGNGDVQFRHYNEGPIVMARRLKINTLNELQINLQQIFQLSKIHCAMRKKEGLRL